jgi:hypothetical protein
MDVWKVSNAAIKVPCQIMAFMDLIGIEKEAKSEGKGKAAIAFPNEEIGNDEDDEVDDPDDDFDAPKGKGPKNVVRIGNTFLRQAEREDGISL